jgi:hypothetical protein
MYDHGLPTSYSMAMMSTSSPTTLKMTWLSSPCLSYKHSSGQDRITPNQDIEPCEEFNALKNYCWMVWENNQS